MNDKPPLPFILIVKLPLPSAVVAFLVPVSVTVANGTGAPASSLTVPDTARFCANANATLNINIRNSIKNLLMWDYLVLKIANIGLYRAKPKKLLIDENSH